MNIPGTSQISGIMDQNERRKLLLNHPLLQLLNGYTELLQYPCETKSFCIHKFGFPQKYTFEQNVVSRMPTWKLPFVALQTDSEKCKNITLLIHEIDVIAMERYDNPHSTNNSVETLVFTVPETVFLDYYCSIEERKMSNRAICAFTLCADAGFWMNRTCRTLGSFRHMIDRSVQVAEWTTITMNKTPPDFSKPSPLWESFIRLSFIPDDVVNDLFVIVKAITGFKNSNKEALEDAAAAFSFIITLAGQCNHNRFVTLLRELGAIQKLQPYQAAAKLKAAIAQEMKNNTVIPDPAPNLLKRRPSVELIENPNISPPKIKKKPPLLPTPTSKLTTFEKNQPSTSAGRTPPQAAPVCPPPPAFPASNSSSTAPRTTPTAPLIPAAQTKIAPNSVPVKQPVVSTLNKTAPACPPPPVPPAANLSTAAKQTAPASPKPTGAPLCSKNDVPASVKKLINAGSQNKPMSPKETPNQPSVKANTIPVKQPATNILNKKVPPTTPVPTVPKAVTDPRRKPVLPPGKCALPSTANKAKTAAPITPKTAPQTQPPRMNMPKETMKTPNTENIQAEISKKNDKTESHVKESRPLETSNIQSNIQPKVLTKTNISNFKDMVDVSSSGSSSSASSRKNSESEPQATVTQAKSAPPTSSVLEPPPMAPNLQALNPEVRTANVESPTVPSDPFSTPAPATSAPECSKKPEALNTEPSSLVTTLPNRKRTVEEHDDSEASKKPRVETAPEPEKPKALNVKTEDKLFGETSSMAFSDTKSWFRPIEPEIVEEDRTEERKFSNMLRASSPPVDNMSTMVEQDCLDEWEKEQLLEPNERANQPCTSTTVTEPAEISKEEQTPETPPTSQVYDLSRASETARILASLADSIERLDNKGFKVEETFLKGIIRKKK